MERNNFDSHLAQRASLSSKEKQRIYQSFKTIQQAKRRLEQTPAVIKERSHIPKKVGGNTEQLLKDMKNWPHEPVCWSAKAKGYQIRGHTSDTNQPNGGQIIKEFLKSSELDTKPCEPASGGV